MVGGHGGGGEAAADHYDPRSRTGPDPSQWDMTVKKDYMAIVDVTRNKFPFGIENNAPDFSCFIDARGNVGLGTSYPEASLHLVGDAPSLRLQDDRENKIRNGISQDNAWDITGRYNSIRCQAK